MACRTPCIQYETLIGCCLELKLLGLPHPLHLAACRQIIDRQQHMGAAECICDRLMSLF